MLSLARIFNLDSVFNVDIIDERQFFNDGIDLFFGYRLSAADFNEDSSNGADGDSGGGGGGGDVSASSSIALTTSTLPTISTTTVSYAALSITKVVDNNDPQSGDTITYTITVTNLDSVTSSFVVAQDALPLGLNISSATISQGSVANSGIINWNIGDLAPNATATLQLSVVVGSSLAGQTNVSSTAFVYTSLDPSTILASSSVPIAVQAIQSANPATVTSTDELASSTFRTPFNWIPVRILSRMFMIF